MNCPAPFFLCKMELFIRIHSCQLFSLAEDFKGLKTCLRLKLNSVAYSKEQRQFYPQTSLLEEIHLLNSWCILLIQSILPFQFHSV